MANESQYCDNFTGTTQDWSTNGSTPYLDQGETDYIYVAAKKAVSDGYEFPSFSLSGTLTSVDLYLLCESAVGNSIDIDVYDGVDYTSVLDIGADSTKEEKSTDLIGVIDTLAKLNVCRVRIISENSTNAVTVYSARIEAYDDAGAGYQRSVTGIMSASGEVERIFEAVRLIEGDLPSQSGDVERKPLFKRLIEGDLTKTGEIERLSAFKRLIEGDLTKDGEVKRKSVLHRLIEGIL